MGRELIVYKDPKSPISEIFRTLRTNIQFMNTKGKLKTVLVTSTLPGEGKSWVSSNLAITFAQAGKKVILVDADMRKGRQYSIFGVAPIPGLSNYLSGMDYNTGEEISKDLSEYVQETQIENLYLIPAGNIPPNPSELLISEQMMTLLEQLKELCDIVVIDGLPSLLVADSLILTRIVDSTIIVTACKQTKKDDLRQVINSIKNVGGKISGVVLNKVPISAKEYEKSYYYGSDRFENAQITTNNKKDKRVNIRNSSSMEDIKRRTEQYDRLKERTANDLRRNKEYEIAKMEEAKRSKAKKRGESTRSSASAQGLKKKKEQDDKSKKRSKINSESRNELDKIETLENKRIKVEDRENVSFERTNDILKQVSEYLENEKKNLNI